MTWHYLGWRVDHLMYSDGVVGLVAHLAGTGYALCTLHPDGHVSDVQSDRSRLGKLAVEAVLAYAAAVACQGHQRTCMGGARSPAACTCGRQP